MIDIFAKYQEWKPEHHLEQAPVLEGHEDPVVLRDMDTKQIVAAQLFADPEKEHDRRWLARMLRFKVKFDDDSGATSSQSRLSGMRYASKVFGVTEPKPLRKRFGCAAAKIHFEHPAVGRMLNDMAADHFALLRQLVPAEAVQHESIVRERIHPDWWMGSAPWTSGIINKTAALPYHRDSGNIPGTWSVMMCLRNRVSGGCLHLPEYGVTFAVPDNSLLFFDGQGIWHGVTPILCDRRDGYRFTFVWYAKKGISKAGPASQEAERAAIEASRQYA